MEIGCLLGILTGRNFKDKTGAGPFLGLLISTRNGPYTFKHGTFGVIFFLLRRAFKGGRQRTRVFVPNFFGRSIGCFLCVFPGNVSMEPSGRTTLGTYMFSGLHLTTGVNMPFYGVLIRKNGVIRRFLLFFYRWGFSLGVCLCLSSCCCGLASWDYGPLFSRFLGNIWGGTIYTTIVQGALYLRSTLFNGGRITIYTRVGGGRLYQVVRVVRFTSGTGWSTGGLGFTGY